MTENPNQFGKLLYAPVNDGRIAKLKDSDVRTLYILTAHVGGDGWIARPSIERLAELSGRTERTVQRSIKRLELAGLVQVMRSKGRKTNQYLILHNPVTVVTGFEDSQPRKSKPPTPSRQTLNPVNSGTQPRNSYDTRTEEQKEQTEQRGNCVGDDIVCLLGALGVNTSVMSSLKSENLTQDEVLRLWMDQPAGVDNPQGKLITDLRTGREPEQQPTPKAISDIVEAGYITHITAGGIRHDCEAESVGHNVKFLKVGETRYTLDQISSLVFAYQGKGAA